MLLAINTAFMDANIGLVLDNGKILGRTIDAKSKHSENVLKTIDEMCEEGNVLFRDIDKVAIVVGPGSFTGIRIGVTTARALCQVWKRPIAAVGTLESFLMKINIIQIFL